MQELIIHSLAFGLWVVLRAYNHSTIFYHPEDRTIPTKKFFLRPWPNDRFHDSDNFCVILIIIFSVFWILALQMLDWWIPVTIFITEATLLYLFYQKILRSFK